MLLNLILLLAVILAIVILIRQLRKPNVDKYLIPTCDFKITYPEFQKEDNIRIAKFNVITKNKDKYFRDFPIGFKFYSDQKFRSKIKISYNISGDDEVEIIYDRIVEFDENIKEHIYYMNDVIIGAIEVEVYTESQYGKPTILFELLQSNTCHMGREHKLEIVFPD